MSLDYFVSDVPGRSDMIQMQLPSVIQGLEATLIVKITKSYPVFANERGRTICDRSTAPDPSKGKKQQRSEGDNRIGPDQNHQQASKVGVTATGDEDEEWNPGDRERDESSATEASNPRFGVAKHRGFALAAKRH